MIRPSLGGFLWGVAAGLFVDGVLLVATSAWLAAAVVPVVIPVVVGGVAGAWVAGRRKNRAESRTRRSWLWRSFVVFAVWPLCALSPVGVRWLQLYREAVCTPLPPGWQRVEVQVVVLAFDDPPGYRVELQGPQAPTRAVGFCAREFVQRGWTALPVHQRHEYTYHQFRKPRRLATMLGWTATGYAGATHRIRIVCCAANLSYKCRPMGTR